MSDFDAVQFTFDIPRGYSDSTRRAIAERVISRIIERTESQIDKDGKKFAPLEQDYAAKKLAGGGSPVPNLRLTGELHSDLQYKPSQSSSTKITVGYKKGSESNSKARGHITGWENKLPKKKRDFMGLPQSDIDQILETTPKDDITDQIIERAALLREVLDRVGFSFDEEI